MKTQNRCTRARVGTRNPSLQVLAALSLALAVSACTDNGRTDGIAGPRGESVYVCHTFGPNITTIENVSIADLAMHKAHGDYVPNLYVDKNGTTGDSVHFKTITAALAVARADRVTKAETDTAACRITIAVAPGTYSGTSVASTDATIEHFPLIIDVPKISIVGAFKMAVDASGKATGVGTNSDASILVASPALVVPTGGSQTGVSEEMIVVNTHPGGTKGSDALIEGFVMRSGHAVGDAIHGGQAVFSMRATGLIVRGNRFEGNFTERVDLRASTATIERNYSTGVGDTCDLCIAGPGTYVVRDNRMAAGGGIPGILSAPMSQLPVSTFVEQIAVPSDAIMNVTITNNEVRGHQAVPVGVGIRLAALGFGSAAVPSTTNATISGNVLTNNRFGLIFEAGFPANGTLSHGDMNVTTSGNVITGSCENDVHISLARHTTGLGLNTNPYMKNSTYTFAFGTDAPFASAWYANPTGNGNTLVVNGATIPNGTNVAYDATKVCTAS